MMKLCLNSNKSMCKSFRSEGDEEVDVKYICKLTKIYECWNKWKSGKAVNRRNNV